MEKQIKTTWSENALNQINHISKLTYFFNFTIPLNPSWYPHTNNPEGEWCGGLGEGVMMKKNKFDLKGKLGSKSQLWDQQQEQQNQQQQHQ